MKTLRESKEPCTGIFWFVQKDEEIEKFQILYLDIPQDAEIQGNSRNGLTFTHKNTWSDLSISCEKSIKNKQWDYFPRGRVEIRNNKATVYLNPNINTPEYQKDIIDAFNLHRINTKFISDGSTHYKCFLDK